MVYKAMTTLAKPLIYSKVHGSYHNRKSFLACRPAADFTHRKVNSQVWYLGGWTKT